MAMKLKEFFNLGEVQQTPWKSAGDRRTSQVASAADKIFGTHDPVEDE